MYVYFVESHVVLPNSSGLIDRLCLRIATFCESTIEKKAERTFVFIDGQAVVREVTDGYLFTVGATDLLSCQAIKTILAGAIFEIAPVAPKGIAWYWGDRTS